MTRTADLFLNKRAVIFELDDVLYPEKDYLLQVYYLFSSFIEYTETLPAASDMVRFLKTAYEHHGPEGIFDRAKEAFGIDEKYRVNFLRLHVTAQLPLKLLLYDQVLKLLQELVVDRKQIFVVTNGNPEQQLNKLRQIEWNGLEGYLTVYFADEIKPKPEIDVLTYILDKHRLARRDLVIYGNSARDEEFAMAAGVDYVPVTDLI